MARLNLKKNKNFTWCRLNAKFFFNKKRSVNKYMYINN